MNWLASLLWLWAGLSALAGVCMIAGVPGMQLFRLCCLVIILTIAVNLMIDAFKGAVRLIVWGLD